MKRFILALSFLVVFANFTWAQNSNESENENEQEQVQVQDVVYRTNGHGDQFLRLGIMFNIPLNFDDKLYLGGAAQLGYYRFLNSWLALGGELMASYNPTLGSNILTCVPITFGVMFQPYIWHFEFPIILSAGMALETSNNKKQFPAFIAKAQANVYYRFNESFSLGLGCDFVYMPEWTKQGEYDYGLFLTPSISVRYHF